MAQVTHKELLSPSLDRLARVLWPSTEAPGHLLRATGHVIRSADGPIRPQRYAAVPSTVRPRFLLPLDAPVRTRARLLLHYNHLRTDRRRAQRLALAGLAALGLPRPRAGRGLLVEPGPAPDLREAVAEALDVPAASLVLSVGVRPGTGPLTPTVTVVDLAGRPQAFVKVADRAESRAELEAEHDVLTTLHHPPGTGVLVPGPMFRFEWQGRLVVGIEPLPLDVRRVGPQEREATAPYLERLVASHDSAWIRLDDSPWTARLRSEVDDQPVRWAQPIRDALERAVTRRGDRPLRHGLRHGDWSSWNMAWSRSVGGLAVWDWEYSEPMAPVGLDRCNWHFAYDTSVRHLSATDAASRMRASEPSDGGDPDVVELLLLDMAVRRARQGADGDDRSAAYADELVTLLR